MAKATGKKKPAVEPPPPKPRQTSAADRDIAIAVLDAKLVELVQQRAKLFAAGAGAGQEAVAEQAAAFDAGEGPLPERVVRTIFREIESGCRSLVRQTRIAFLGPPYSYSHLAAIHRFGKSVQFVPVGTIAAVFEEVHCGHADVGLAPLENSTDGRIADTLEMFTRLPVRICGQVEMAIHHWLLAKCSRAEVREVYSRPQAISQCRNWLAKHLPSARAIEVASTLTAAQLAAEKPGAAAIASPQVGVEYGLNVLAENIEDNPGNTTRFAVIGGRIPERTGNDRTAMLFQVEHRPGALADAMNIFKRNKLNLTWIESFPAPGASRGYYLFFVEMEGHQNDLRLRRAVASLARKTLRLEILGSFPATGIVE